MPATFNYLTPALPCGTATARSARLRVAARQRRSIAQRAAESTVANYRRNVTPAATHPQCTVRETLDTALGKMNEFREGHLRHAIEQYFEHCHTERNHQGIEDELMTDRREPPSATSDPRIASVGCSDTTTKLLEFNRTLSRPRSLGEIPVLVGGHQRALER